MRLVYYGPTKATLQKVTKQCYAQSVSKDSSYLQITDHSQMPNNFHWESREQRMIRLGKASPGRGD